MASKPAREPATSQAESAGWAREKNVPGSARFQPYKDMLLSCVFGAGSGVALLVFVEHGAAYHLLRRIIKEMTHLLPIKNNQLSQSRPHLSNLLQGNQIVAKIKAFARLNESPSNNTSAFRAFQMAQAPRIIRVFHPCKAPQSRLFSG